MGLEDFINLDTIHESGPKSEDNGPHNSNSSASEPECKISTSHMKNGILNETFNGNGNSEVGNHMQILDHEVDLMQEHVLRENVELVDSVTMVDKVNEVEIGQETDDGYAVSRTNCTTNNLLVDESPIAGVKRARMEYVDQQPSVRVVYSCLTRESKKKLMELMQQWSEWHAQCQSPINESIKEDLESGEEIYFPALQVGSEKSSTVSFWLDNQSRKEDIEYKLDNDMVPLYDRGCMLGLPDGSAIPERIGTLEASRCFNCGSYSHSLKECPKPRDNVAIVNARKQLNSKRNQVSGSRSATRYYQKSPGKFDDLRAGVLGPETRESLGIGEFDPPPWLHRMREMGYPPGYLDVVEDEDQPSGIEIFGDGEKAEYEDGELPEKDQPEPPEKKMSVEFPGINAPVPETADHRLWAAPSGFSGSKNRSNPKPNRPIDTKRGQYHDQRWSAEHRDPVPPAPPGTEYGSVASMPGYSPRYSPYDHNAVPRSPSLGRSLSDRGWRSPLPYESSPHSPHSPYPFSGLPRQSPQYRSPVPGPEHWNPDNPYSVSPGISSQHPRDWHDHRRPHRN